MKTRSWPRQHWGNLPDCDRYASLVHLEAGDTLIGVELRGNAQTYSFPTVPPLLGAAFLRFQGAALAARRDAGPTQVSDAP